MDQTKAGPESLAELQHLILKGFDEVLRTLAKHEQLLLNQPQAQSMPLEPMDGVVHTSSHMSVFSNFPLSNRVPLSPKAGTSLPIAPLAKQQPGEDFCTFSQVDDQLKREAEEVNAVQVARLQTRHEMDQTSESEVKSRTTLTSLVLHPGFDIFVAGVVFANALFMGVELQNDLTMLQPIHLLFSVIFLVELLLRIAVFGRGFFYNEDRWWNLLDSVIVGVAAVEMVFLVRDWASGTGSEESSSNLTGFRSLKILRITRMLKIIRILRIFRFVLALRTLIQSTIHTLKALFWALVLLALIIYIFSLILAEAVLTSGSTHEDGKLYFGSLGRTMLTLFMSITGGLSWEDVVEVLRETSSFYVILFVVYVAFTYFAVLNVMTAVFCESAIESAQRDHSTMCQMIMANKEMHIEKINSLFFEIDQARTGTITFEMFEKKMESDEVRTFFETIDIDVWDAWAFFKLLDLDGGGAVEIEDFLLGCLRLRGTARSMDVVKLLYDQAWHIKNQGRFWMFMEEQILLIQHQLSSLGAKKGSKTADL